MDNNYYNEHDPKAAAWLRELIKQGCIAPGIVDERSIEDVTPEELKGFTQCHFFAGIGVWSHALRRAGWSDDRAVWTASCPCQPFSSAGKSGGFVDERHLWPAFYHLVANAKRPDISLFGEQVASKDGLAWLDVVQADMEAAGHAVRCVDMCAAGVGAPHIRQRLFFVAERVAGAESLGGDKGLQNGSGGAGGSVPEQRAERKRSSPPRGMADPHQLNDDIERSGAGHDGRQLEKATGLLGGDADTKPTGPTNGFWRDADWLGCRDGKWRPVEPGTFPLAHGAPARVGRLRGYGNAINAEVAKAFIASYMETQGLDLI